VGRVRSPANRRNLAWAALGLGTLTYAVTLTAASIHRHDLFQSGYDVAIFDQGSWLLGHLHDPFSTVRGRNLFADHFQPALVLFAPFGLLGLTPWALFVFQAGALAAAGVVLALLARIRGAPPALAAAVGGLWLASPLVQWANLFEFHPETTVPLLLAVGALLLERGRTAAFVVCAALACGFKEDVALVVAFWGVALAVSGRRRLGGSVFVAAVTLFVVATKVVLPAFGGNLDYYSRRFAGDRGTSVGSVFTFVVEHPGAALDQLATRQNGVLLFALVACTGGLALLAPRMLLLAVPPVAANVLSAYAYQHDLHFHYQIVSAGAFAIAGAYGAGTLARLRPRFVRAAALVLAAGAIGVTVSASPAIDLLRHETPSPHAAAKRAALALVPSGVPVAGEPDVIAHLAQRRAVYQLPEPFISRPTNGEAWSDTELRRRAAAVRYVVYSTGALDPGLESEVERVPAMLAKRGFRTIFSRDGVVVYSRGG
jgi:uncharacterized membrane protein